MIIIRLLRIGKKKQPAYKIVVTDKKNPPVAGRFVDEVGFYNPLTKERSINGDKVKHWISKGATLSDTVHNLLVAGGLIEEKKKPKHNTPNDKKGVELKVSIAKNESPAKEKSKVFIEEPKKEIEVEA